MSRELPLCVFIPSSGPYARFLLDVEVLSEAGVTVTSDSIHVSAFTYTYFVACNTFVVKLLLLTASS
jgi:hypothetical protein